jgi:hypothetical protein
LAERSETTPKLSEPQALEIEAQNKRIEEQQKQLDAQKKQIELLKQIVCSQNKGAAVCQ